MQRVISLQGINKVYFFKKCFLLSFVFITCLENSKKCQMWYVNRLKTASPLTHWPLKKGTYSEKWYGLLSSCMLYQPWHLKILLRHEDINSYITILYMKHYHLSTFTRHQSVFLTWNLLTATEASDSDLTASGVTLRAKVIALKTATTVKAWGGMCRDGDSYTQ